MKERSMFDESLEKIVKNFTMLLRHEAESCQVYGVYIRHATALNLRGARWFVTDQSVGDLLLGHPVLEALELNTRKIHAVAAEKHAGVVDVKSLFHGDESENTNGKVVRILKGVYHADGGADDRFLSDSNGWSNLGPKHPVEKRKVLIEKVKNAANAGVSAKGCVHLRELLREFGNTIKLRLDADNPALIEPLRLKLNSDAVLIRTKPESCPPRKNSL